MKPWEELDTKAAKLQVQLNDLELGAAEFDSGVRSLRAEWRRASLAYDVDGVGDADVIEAMQLRLLQGDLLAERRQYAAAELRQRLSTVDAERKRLFLNQPAKFERRTPALEAIETGGSGFVGRAIQKISAGGWETVSRDRLFNELRNYGTTAENPLRDLLNGEILLCGTHEYKATPLDG